MSKFCVWFACINEDERFLFLQILFTVGAEDYPEFTPEYLKELELLAKENFIQENVRCIGVNSVIAEDETILLKD